MPWTRREFAGLMGAVAVGSWSALQAAEDTAAVAKKSGKPAAEKIRVGQIGTAHAHANKLSVYRQSDDYEVVGLVEPDPKRRALLQSQPAYRDVPLMTQEELLNVPGLQVVLVETEVRDLLTTAEACVTAGKHIHLDKPAGESLSHFQRILQTAESKRLVVQMGYMFRYNPGVVMLREFLKQGWLGEIFEVQTLMSKVVPPDDRRKLSAYPGGIMFELSCHVIDLVIGLLGTPKKITPFAQHVSPIDDGLLDSQLAVFEYPKALASVRGCAVEIDGGSRRHLTVCGTEGTFHIQPLDDPSVRVALSKPREKYKAGYQDIALPKYTRYVDDAADMARILRGEAENRFPYAHDLAVQTAVLTASGVGPEPKKS
jgi:predicted dehydrogenase